MAVRTLFDVNLLLAILDEEHIHHERAHAWWTLNQEGGSVALAVRNGGRLATFDSAVPLPAVRAAESRHLVVL